MVIVQLITSYIFIIVHVTKKINIVMKFLAKTSFEAFFSRFDHELTHGLSVVSVAQLKSFVLIH